MFLFIDTIEQDGRHVFEDVLNEFGTIGGILEKFEMWRQQDMDAYTEAYVSLCIAKVLSPIIRLKLLLWNPINQVYILIKNNTLLLRKK